MPYLYDNKEKMEEIYIEGPYELNEHVCLEKEDVVIDCGANLGLFSAIASMKGCHVYSFEPDPDIISKYLNKTAQLNKNITIVQAALGKETGKIHFSQDNSNLGGGHVSETGIECDIFSLDDWAEKNNIEKIDFIKADIEGAEREMLKGCSNVLKHYAPKLSICTYHLSDDKEVLENLIRQANENYIIEHHYQKLYAYVPK